MGTNSLKKLQSGKIFMFLLMMLAVLTVGAGSAFADGGQSSGIDTILRSSSLEGQDTFRNTIAGYLHKPISLIITIAGFLIITFSFLKVVITLLYLTFPDIFDKIDAHQKQSLQGGFRDKSPIDMISYVFALIMPNVKSLTDYSDDNSGLDVTPMDYLKKKLPMVIFFVIIGAMIFDGQARSFMAKAADVGMFFGNIVERHDTVGAVANFVGDGERYTFTYDTATQSGKNKEKIAKAVQKHLHGLNPNLKSVEHSDAVGALSEKITDQIVSDMTTAAAKGGIKSFDEIVSFNIGFTSRSTQLKAATTGKGSGVMQVTVDDAKVLDISKQKYLVVSYSQIVDKDNRNFLFKATESVEPKSNTKP